jgi:hypothetical protein
VSQNFPKTTYNNSSAAISDFLNKARDNGLDTSISMDASAVAFATLANLFSSVPDGASVGKRFVLEDEVTTLNTWSPSSFCTSIVRRGNIVETQMMLQMQGAKYPAGDDKVIAPQGQVDANRAYIMPLTVEVNGYLQYGTVQLLGLLDAPTSTPTDIAVWSSSDPTIQSQAAIDNAADAVNLGNLSMNNLGDTIFMPYDVVNPLWTYGPTYLYLVTDANVTSRTYAEGLLVITLYGKAAV